MELKFETIEWGRARVCLLPGYRKFFMNRSQTPHDGAIDIRLCGWAAYLDPFKGSQPEKASRVDVALHPSNDRCRHPCNLERGILVFQSSALSGAAVAGCVSAAPGSSQTVFT